MRRGWGEALRYYHIPEYGNGTPTVDTVLYDVAKHYNGATDEVVMGCSMRRGVFGNLLPCSMVPVTIRCPPHNVS